MLTVFYDFLRKLNWKFLVGLFAFCVLAAAVNNLRQPAEKKLPWIGGQPVLEVPK